MMKFVLQILVVVSIFVFYIACNDGKKAQNVQLFQGCWIMQDSSMQYSECWEKVNDSLYSAKCITKMDATVLDSEWVSLYKIDKTWIYSAIAFGQNNNNPVDFKLHECSDNSFLFVNDQHDFPQKICYKWLNSDTLLITVKGQDQSGLQKEIKFSMKAFHGN